MIEALPHLLNIGLGFIARMVAIKSTAQSETMDVALKALVAREGAVAEARKYDSPAANASRRTLLWFVMIAIMISIVGYMITGTPIYVEQIVKDPSFLFGLFGGGERIEWVKIEGIPSYQEFFQWGTMLFELYFGSTLARRG